jgi:hypothetical protein
MPPTEHNGIRYRDLPDPRQSDDPAERIRSALFFVVAYARRLADQIEKMERFDDLFRHILDGEYYLASDIDDDTLLADPYERVADPIEKHRLTTIESMFTLRRVVNTACDVVRTDAGFMDGWGESADRRWTTRATRTVLAVRNAALRGHAGDAFPSAFPRLHIGVADHIRVATRDVQDFVVVAKCVVVVRPPQMQIAGETSVASRDSASTEKPRATDPLHRRLHPNHSRVLRYLARQREAKTQVIMTAKNESGIKTRKTLGPLLRDLIDWGFVELFDGERDGYVITPLGQEWLAHHAGTASGIH